jgi:hypothetical protein
VKGRLTRAALHAHPVAVAHAAKLGVMRVNFQNVFRMTLAVLRTSCLRADIILRQNAPGGEQQREARARALVRRHMFGDDELAFAAREAPDMHDRHAVRRSVVAGPLHRTNLFELIV